MTGTCPHCGAHLPLASDPFCGQCRQAVDEPPAAPLTSDQKRILQLNCVKLVRYSGWFSLIVGIIAAGTNPPKLRGSIEDVVDLVFVIAGAGLIGFSYWLARRATTASELDETKSRLRKN